MKNLICLVFVLFLSCKVHQCKTLNYTLINEFEKNLKIVKEMHQGKKVKTLEYKNALQYLVKTTEIMTRADYSSTLGFKNDNDYNHDMNLWKEWLKRNRCLN